MITNGTLGTHEQDSWRFRWRGGIGLVTLGIGAALMLLSPPSAAEGSRLDVSLEILAWPIFCAGVVLRFWATLYIGGRKGSQVVSDGPYSITRNPLYLGTMMLAASAGLFTGSLVLTAATLAMAVFYARMTIPTEERSLAARLGAPYQQYVERVPRLWPRLATYHTRNFIEVELRPLLKEARSALGYCWIPMLGELIELLRNQPWWPHPWSFH